MLTLNKVFYYKDAYVSKNNTNIILNRSLNVA